MRLESNVIDQQEGYAAVRAGKRHCGEKRKYSTWLLLQTSTSTKITIKIAKQNFFTVVEKTTEGPLTEQLCISSLVDWACYAYKQFNEIFAGSVGLQEMPVENDSDRKKVLDKVFWFEQCMNSVAFKYAVAWKVVEKKFSDNKRQELLVEINKTLNAKAQSTENSIFTELYGKACESVEKTYGHVLVPIIMHGF